MTSAADCVLLPKLLVDAHLKMNPKEILRAVEGLW